MSDIKIQVWYDETKSPDENYILAEGYFAANYDVENLTVEQETEILGFYTQLRLMARALKEKINTFNTAKDQAFNDLSIIQDTERQTLGVEWQAKEDNDYTIG